MQPSAEHHDGNADRVTVTETFGPLIRARRREAGLTQEEFAEVCGLSSKFVAHLERAERQPSLTTLIQLGRGLGVKASELVADVERALDSR